MVIDSPEFTPFPPSLPARAGGRNRTSDDDCTIAESWKNGDTVVMKTCWWVTANGVTMHARFDNTHGAVMELSGHKLD